MPVNIPFLLNDMQAKGTDLLGIWCVLTACNFQRYWLLFTYWTWQNCVVITVIHSWVSSLLNRLNRDWASS